MDSTIDRKWLVSWDYTKRDFVDDTFSGMPDDDEVETILASQNHFTRLDFFRSKSLQKLCLNHNEIAQIIIGNNYPNLQIL
jgi:hypothetical protein